MLTIFTNVSWPSVERFEPEHACGGASAADRPRIDQSVMPVTRAFVFLPAEDQPAARMRRHSPEGQLVVHVDLC